MQFQQANYAVTRPSSNPKESEDLKRYHGTVCPKDSKKGIGFFEQFVLVTLLVVVQRWNRGEIFGATSAMLGRICPLPSPWLEQG